MSTKLLSSAYGLYLPSLLRIELNIDFDYGKNNWNNNNDYQKSTFVHEYIHYLQDISTTYGLLNFNFLMGTIQGCMNKIADSKDKEISLPIDLSYIEDYEKQAHLISIYQGDCDNLSGYRIVTINYEVEEMYEELYGDNIYQVILNLDNNGKEESYRFGGMCILESMAYLIESYGYKSESMRNTAPYNLCEEVASLVYDEFPVNNKSLLVALCDISLMSPNPGTAFYDLLRAMKLHKFIPNDIDEVYEFNETYIESNDMEIYDEQLSLAQERIDFIYSSNLSNIDIVKQANKWIKERLFLAKIEREKNKKFIVDIMNNNEDFEKIFFEKLHLFGIPLIKNNQGEIFNGTTIINPDLNLIFLNIPIMLVKIFDYQENNNVCELINLCREYNPKLYDDECINSPWEKSQKDNLCPFGIMWYHRCLDGKSIKR